MLQKFVIITKDTFEIQMYLSYKHNFIYKLFYFNEIHCFICLDSLIKCSKVDQDEGVGCRPVSLHFIT